MLNLLQLFLFKEVVVGVSEEVTEVVEATEMVDVEVVVVWDVVVAAQEDPGERVIGNARTIQIKGMYICIHC